MLPKDATIAVSANGKTVNVKVQAKKKMKEIAQKFEASLCGNDAVKPFYDPVSAVNGNLDMNGVGEYQQYLYEVSDEAEELNTAQIAHRVKLFAKVVSLLSEETVLAKIIDAAPKKKNGTLYAKSVTQVQRIFFISPPP